MSDTKYIGMDVHGASTSVAVRDSDGKLILEAVLKTDAATLLNFMDGLRGTLHVTFEEGTYAQWLHGVLVDHVAKLIVCNPRKNGSLKRGNKNDRIDARKLSKLLYGKQLSSVYHHDHGTAALRELGRSYTALTQDTVRTMSRIRAIFRSRSIRAKGHTLYTQRKQTHWLQQLPAAGVRPRVTRLFQELRALQQLRREARRDMIAESRRHPLHELLRSLKVLGDIRVALLIARLRTPHRFRTKRQLWEYAGLGVETRTSSEYVIRDNGQLERSRKKIVICGLNADHNHELKDIFKGAALTASRRPGPLQDWYTARFVRDPKTAPEMALLDLARKIAAIALVLCKKGERFDPRYLKTEAA
jgi:transposase